MSIYVDGFVLPLPKDKVEAYKKLSETAAVVWMEHGALDYRECLGDDLDTEHCTSFKALAGCGPDETVVFAWITYPSREQRDTINEAVMKDPRLGCMEDPSAMPFDCKRMAYGGFTTLVHASKQA
ncbi:DUF1428 domain-containing protein [Luteolibacter flavescens]|uniref:DUF1428 domain-containing protein n=1 Tax=Luteolibacter flavescens TaxID=1859460 RepID=A0ABT3FTX6_9BACT|nr:DUF1428 domain-containing protein [Luteolibacter flavescens]MCW1886435.1 DUF1428 domain-containing protein [Luteolibacter flavescens]